MNQLFFLQKINAFASDCECCVCAFTGMAKCRTDQLCWCNVSIWCQAVVGGIQQRNHDELSCEILVSQNVLSVIDQQIGILLSPQWCTSTRSIRSIEWKKINCVKNTVTRKCRLCLRGDWQKEGVDFFKRKTFSAVLKSTMQESDRLYAVLTVTSLRHLPRANWMCLCVAFAHLDLSVQRVNIGRRFAAALLPRLFGKNPRSHHKGATGRVRTGNCSNWTPTASSSMPLPTWTRHPRSSLYFKLD